jgi:hypothetical protein
MRILQDIFPAVISMTTTQPTPEAPLAGPNPATVLHAKTVDRARVIVTESRILVAVDSPEGPLVIFSQTYDQSTANRSRQQRQDSFLTTGTTTPVYVAYRRGEDCSCGSRLRGWNPFGTLHATN